jgi:hypothetical protein
VLVLAAACDGEPAAPSAPAAQEEPGSILAEVPLREAEAPPGLRPDQEGTGPITSIRQVLPPRQRFPNLPPLPDGLREEFLGGYERAYAGGGRTAASSAVSFGDVTAAATFLDYVALLPVGGNATDPQPVTASGLGEEGHGWYVRVPQAESAQFVWRVGEVVASLTLSGPIGQAGPETALALAEHVDGRLP